MRITSPNKGAAPNRRLRLGLVPWSFESLMSQGSAIGELRRCYLMATRYEQQTPFRFHVGLQVSSESASPDEITALLGLQPYRSSRKGELPKVLEALDERASAVYTRHHKWAASFEPMSLTEPLNDCLLRVARHFVGHSNALSQLSESGTIDLYIYAYPGSLPDPVDWGILHRIRSEHPVGLQIHLSSRLETDRPIDENRPKNRS
jgi:hypothetical protein